MRIRHIIFDCFGTLIDTGTGSVRAASEILGNVGSAADARAFYADWKRIKKRMMRTLPFESEKSFFAKSLQETFALYGIKADAQTEVAPMIRSLFAERRAYPDVREALRALEEKGFDLAIGSTTDTDSLLYYLRENALSFAHIYTSEDMRVYKPDVRFYETILRRSGWTAEECLFVGDSIEDDVKGPKAAGLHAALLDRKGTFAGPEDDTDPDLVIRSLLDLTALL